MKSSKIIPLLLISFSLMSCSDSSENTIEPSNEKSSEQTTEKSKVSSQYAEAINAQTTKESNSSPAKDNIVDAKPVDTDSAVTSVDSHKKEPSMKTAAQVETPAAKSSASSKGKVNHTQRNGLILTKDGIKKIQADLGNIPLFDSSLKTLQAEVDAEIEKGIETPIPKDFSGGYTHLYSRYVFSVRSDVQRFAFAPTNAFLCEREAFLAMLE